ncbi:MAG: histidinol-phosphatase HisJ family protein [Candidatus Bathyarchaeia archaeon]
MSSDYSGKAEGLNQMLVDYHIHTKASDGIADMKEYVDEAKRKDIDEIGFSDHVNFRKNYHVLQPKNTKNYVQNFFEIEEEVDLPIKLGVEIDFFPNETEKIKKFIQKYPFDYVMGAVHFIGTWGIDHPSQMHEYLKRDIWRVYEEYFKIVRELCRSRLFDVLAHVDLIKIFGFKPKCDISNILIETAEVIAQYDICVEVNTSGLRKQCMEKYPSKQFLKILQNHDVAITLGSDAHNPQDIGRSFNQAIQLIKEVGYNHLCTFKSRKRKTEKI